MLSLGKKKSKYPKMHIIILKLKMGLSVMKTLQLDLPRQYFFNHYTINIMCGFWKLHKVQEIFYIYFTISQMN
jgi:hypothetical protein